MKMKRIIFTAFSGVFILSAICLAISFDQSPVDQGFANDDEGLATKIDTADAKSEWSNQSSIEADAVDNVSSSENYQKINSELQSMFPNGLVNVSQRVKASGKIALELNRLYGDEWRSHFNEFVERFFQDESLELLAVLEKMESLEEAQNYLMTEKSIYTSSELEDRVWEMRKEAFGEDYKMVWRGSYINMRLENVMSDLSTKELPLRNQQNRFMNEIAALSYDLGEIFPSNDPYSVYRLSEEFMGFPSVREKMNALSPEQRSAEILRIRKSFGLQDDVISRLNTLDNLRRDRDVAGKEYMKKRNAIMDSGKVSELNVLREQTFGEFAQKIAAEEERGYFRYGGG